MCMKKAIKWLGSTKCDICGKQIENILYDARTHNGCWATMCEKCFHKHTDGVLGTGYGQKYVCYTSQEFLKSEG